VTRELTDDEIGSEYEHSTGEVIVETVEKLGIDPLERPAVLVASHGPFAWGANAGEAVENAIALEAVAESSFRTELLRPGAEQLQPGLLDRHFLRKHGPGAYYGQS
jgi:L-ribulose-5-phosphate 4-epimerase